MINLIRVLTPYAVGFLLGVAFMLASVSPVKATSTTTQVRIGIIDTGYNGTKLRLCKDGHYDFMTDTPTLAYTEPHGTMVGNIIADGLNGKANYCAVIFQIKDRRGYSTLSNYVRALLMMAKLNISVVNISVSGMATSVIERDALKLLSDRGVKIFVAAGNEGKNLDYECDIFPTCYDIANLHPVGSLSKASTQARTSNRGKRIKLWFSGQYGEEFGTSFASPRALVQFVIYSRPQTKQ